jgi:hypothetical protein
MVTPPRNKRITAPGAPGTNYEDIASLGATAVDIRRDWLVRQRKIGIEDGLD